MQLQNLKACMLCLLKKVAKKIIYLAKKVLGVASTAELDFTSVIYPEELGLDPQQVYRSSPSGNAYLSNLLADMGISKSDSIIDIGSGKGSAMKAMLEFPFKKVAGIEISEHIVKIAKKNFKILKSKNAFIYNCNAVTFERYSEYNFFYFYNPFPSEVMVNVIKKIHDSTLQLANEIIIIYNNPTCHSDIVCNTKFSKVREYPDEWGNKIFIYSNRIDCGSRLSK